MTVQIKKAYADTSIGQIHYRHAGKGDPLLLLHQTATCSEIYEPLIQHLAPSFSIVAMDTPGFGMSAPPPQPYTISEYAALVREFLDALHIPRTSVFGHHTGASIACELAAASPDRVEKLVLSGPPCFSAAERQQRLNRIPPMEFKADASHVLVAWEYLTRLVPPGRDLDLPAKHRELVWRLKAGPGFINTYRAVFTYDMPSRLPLIQAPTLVVAGEYDTLRPAVEPTARLIKRARHQVLTGATIWIEAQNYGELARTITAFLKDPGV